MTSSDPNADAASSKYHVQIGEGQGIVIGDNPRVAQHFHGASLEPQVDLTAAEATYRQKVADAYKSLNFSGFASSDLSLANVPLEDVFVQLTLTIEKVITVPVQSEELSHPERHKNQQRERVITVQEPIELGQVLSNHLLIVGEPGVGKSTLLRWLAVTFAQGNQREPNRVGLAADADRLPLFVELGRLPNRFLKPEGGEIPNWLQFLPEYLTSQMDFTNTPSYLLTRALADGRCLLLFDGLDEIANRQVRVRVARSLAELARLFPGNRMVIGSRPAGVSTSEGALRLQFQHCQIERWTSEDVQRFFRFWYTLDRGLTSTQQREAADALYTRVQATPATLQLASTPLLATVLVLIWRNEGNLPQRRADLYERCCRMLIEYWEASHDVAYQGALASMDWEDHLRLLAPLAYAVHSQEQRISATRKELVPLLAQSLQTAGYSREQAAATQEAKQFLDVLGLRSGLLQYMGDDRYSFPHLTFQEYLVARYIAAQPDPDYIDLVMIHLHEAWWQQVHLLTIAHLGSGNAGANKASALILTLLHVYTSPHWILRSFVRNRWLLPLIGSGKLLPQVQLERQIAWILAREFELATKGYMECALDGTTEKVGTALSAQATSLVWHIIYDKDRSEVQKALLTIACHLLQRQSNEAVMSALLAALHNPETSVRRLAAESLGQVEVGNEALVSVLLAALHDPNRYVRRSAAESLAQVGVGNEAVVNALLAALHDPDGEIRRLAAANPGQVGMGNKVVVSALLAALHDPDGEIRRLAAAGLGCWEIKDTIQLRQMLVALYCCLHDRDSDYGWQTQTALISIRQLLDGQPIPGYRWVPLRKRRAQRLQLKRIAFWLGINAIVMIVSLVATWLLGDLDPNSFPMRFLIILAGIVAIWAVIAQVSSRTLRDPWERS